MARFVKHRSSFSPILLAVPVLSLAAWWVAEFYFLGPHKLGFTFYGALFVALASNIALLALSRYQAAAKPSRALLAVAVVVISITIGAGLRVVLPGIPA
jgi:hypothetical protein